METRIYISNGFEIPDLIFDTKHKSSVEIIQLF